MLESQLYQKGLGMHVARTKVGRLKSRVRSQKLEQEYANEKVFAIS